MTLCSAAWPQTFLQWRYKLDSFCGLADAMPGSLGKDAQAALGRAAKMTQKQAWLDFAETIVLSYCEFVNMLRPHRYPVFCAYLSSLFAGRLRALKLKMNKSLGLHV